MKLSLKDQFKNYKVKNSPRFKKLEIIFNNDFKLSVSNFKKNYNHNTMSKNTQEVLIEMIFQLGIKGQKKFIKINNHLKKKQVFME